MQHFEQELRDIAQSVWSSFLETKQLSAQGNPQESDWMGARVGIQGAWVGTIEVACGAEIRTTLTAAMFDPDQADTTDETAQTSFSPAQQQETLNEIANIIAGNLKALVPGPSQLTLPHAVTKPVLETIPLLTEVCLYHEGRPLRIRVYGTAP